jgi:hypothetical protein
MGRPNVRESSTVAADGLASDKGMAQIRTGFREDHGHNRAASKTTAGRLRIGRVLHGVGQVGCGLLTFFTDKANFVHYF